MKIARIETFLFDPGTAKNLLFCRVETESGLHGWLKDKHGALLNKLETNKAMDKDAEAELTSAIEAFKKTFA